jgi:uncharacterized protein YbaP (TraB family)
MPKAVLTPDGRFASLRLGAAHHGLAYAAAPREGLMRKLITAAIAALAFSAGAAQADPALWRIAGPHTTIYLFGTVHWLRKDIAWRSAKIDEALADAQELWLETADADEKAALQPLIVRFGADPAHPLSSKISAVDLTKLDTAAKSLGQPGEAAIERFQPWLVGMLLADVPAKKAGYDPNSGVERIIKAEAVAAKKPLYGLETVEGQVRLLADMPQALQVQFLEIALDDVEVGPAKLDALVSSWSRGDVEGISKFDNELATKQPQIYRALIVNRDQRWAATLAARLQQPGVVFAAVGAAHLSVQAFLAQEGVNVERVNRARGETGGLVTTAVVAEPGRWSC